MAVSRYSDPARKTQRGGAAAAARPAGPHPDRRTRLLLILAVLASACGRDAADVERAVVRDSAGVRIVENGEFRPAEWRVEAEPLFTVGWGAGEPAFTWIQAGRILPDGGALVGDFRAGTIHRIGADGAVVQTLGRKGGGPGEYQALDAILLRGDTILVSDGRLRRLTTLAPDGTVRTTALAGASFHRVSAVWPDGRLLLVPGEGYGAVADTRLEWVFETQPILAMDPGDGSIDTLAVLPHLRRWYGTRAASPGPVQVKGRAGGFDDGFVWGRSDEREVRWHDASGRPVQLARWVEEPVPLTREWRTRMVRTVEDAYRSSGMDESLIIAQLAELEDGLDRHEGPLPYWDSFHVDRAGNVWLGAYGLPGQPLTRVRVLDRSGVLVGHLDLPDVVDILDITDDRILAVRHDELDVPAVVMLGLITP